MADLPKWLWVARGVNSIARLSWGWLRPLRFAAGRFGTSASRQMRLADASAGGAGVECWLRQVKLDFAAHTTLNRAPVLPTAPRSLRFTHTREWVVAVARYRPSR
jgi:hypothetical protein